jgi:Dyp-type peroxidase family
MWFFTGSLSGVFHVGTLACFIKIYQKLLSMPQPSPLLSKKEIDFNDPALYSLLTHLQANILKFHGRPYAWHVLLQFLDAAAVKNWIREYAGNVTNAYVQLQDADTRKINLHHDGGTIICLFLSRQGYTMLGAHIPVGKTALQSMKAPAIQQKLCDVPVDQWEPAFRGDMHAMILLADQNEQQLQSALNAIQEQEAKNILKVIHVQKAEALKNSNGQGIEHFGFVDGISQPTFLKGESLPGNTWNDNATLNMVLVQQNVAGFDDCFGSFLVFRKLEQNVKLFKQRIDELTTKLHMQELAGAYVVGRFENGLPVVKHGIEAPAGNNFDNDFDYSDDAHGNKCPFHAHIRATAPRDKRKPLDRIVRRGMPYDEAGRNNDLNQYPEYGVGLLFMCYQFDIPSQFELLQANWANDGRIDGNNPQTGIDGIIGQGNTNTVDQQWFLQWNGNESIPFKFSGFVTLKGGEYFFAPSIPYLKTIV